MADPTVARETAFIEPANIGVPVADFLDGFTGEGCDETPQTLRFELHDAETDAVQIIRFLSRLGKGYGVNTCVVAFARCLMQGVVTNDARKEQLDTIAGWVLSNVVYQADPRGIEYVRSPVQMLKEWYKTGRAYGDCDDHTLLVNALLIALGIPARPVAVILPGSVDQTFNHVISQVNIGQGWIDLDTCNTSNPLYKFPGERLTGD